MYYTVKVKHADFDKKGKQVSRTSLFIQEAESISDAEIEIDVNLKKVLTALKKYTLKPDGTEITSTYYDYTIESVSIAKMQHITDIADNLHIYECRYSYENDNGKEIRESIITSGDDIDSAKVKIEGILREEFLSDLKIERLSKSKIRDIFFSTKTKLDAIKMMMDKISDTDTNR